MRRIGTRTTNGTRGGLRIATTVVISSFLYQLFSPLIALSLTSGPAQPDFSTFEPVGTSNMVNEFTGAFTYNIPVLSIPGPNGSGYALSLSYHSGVTPEEEASWVGYGWTLNPGAITRNVRGFPDDQNGATIRRWNKVKDNVTIVAQASKELETFSIKGLPDSAKLSGSLGLRYNNYIGFGYMFGTTANYQGVASLSYGLNSGEGSFSYNINPAGLLSYLHEKGKEESATAPAGIAA
ncbi:MAG: hypothetical protein ABIR47_13645, partial [Candidatus Kapaibacterium sp.]